MKAQEAIALSFQQEKIGQVLEDVFIIDYDEESYLYVARSDAFAPDDIDGCIYVAALEELRIGQKVRVRIVDADAYTLTGVQEK